MVIVSSMPTATTYVTRRLNWGCGPTPAPGWINSDRIAAPGVDIARDIRDGLSLATESIDYVVAIHVLQDLAFRDLVPALKELRRVLRTGGVLRLGLPDLDRAIDAYRRKDHAYFYIRDDEVRSLGGKLCVQATWYGSVLTPFTWDFAEELLLAAGFARVTRCAFRRTASPYAAIVDLDNRERESLYVEATK
jgi:hypothetical protein